MSQRYSIGITGDEAAAIRHYGKQMVGSGLDPLPDYDVPLEIQGSGMSSVYSLLLPMVKKAYEYGKPLAKQIGNLALGAIASKAASSSEGDDANATAQPNSNSKSMQSLPGRDILDSVLSRGRSFAIDRASQLRDMGIERTQQMVDQTIDTVQRKANSTIDNLQQRARSVTQAGQAQISEGLSDLERRVIARMRGLEGSGASPEVRHLHAYMGSGIRFADTAGAPRRGVRGAAGVMQSPGTFQSGRFVGSGLYHPGEHDGGGLYLQGSGHPQKKRPY